MSNLFIFDRILKRNVFVSNLVLQFNIQRTGSSILNLVLVSKRTLWSIFRQISWSFASIIIIFFTFDLPSASQETSATTLFINKDGPKRFASFSRVLMFLTPPAECEYCCLFSGSVFQFAFFICWSQFRMIY